MAGRGAGQGAVPGRRTVTIGLHEPHTEISFVAGHPIAGHDMPAPDPAR